LRGGPNRAAKAEFAGSQRNGRGLVQAPSPATMPQQSRQALSQLSRCTTATPRSADRFNDRPCRQFDAATNTMWRKLEIDPAAQLIAQEIANDPAAISLSLRPRHLRAADLLPLNFKDATRRRFGCQSPAHPRVAVHPVQLCI
jgi:hypothetical protein